MGSVDIDTSSSVISLSSRWMESRNPSNFPWARYWIYWSKGSNALAISDSLSFAFSHGGDSAKDFSGTVQGRSYTTYIPLSLGAYIFLGVSSSVSHKRAHLKAHKSVTTEHGLAQQQWHLVAQQAMRTHQ